MSMDTDWFLERIAESRHRSQRQLAQALDMNPASLSLILRGKQRLKLTEAEGIANELGLPLEEVLAHAGVSLSRKPRRARDPFENVPADVRRLLLTTPARDPVWEAVRVVLRSRRPR